MLKRFTSILLNESKNKHLVFVLGRFQPPTAGHEKIINTAFKISQGIPNSDFAIFTTQSYDVKHNPISTRLKVKALREAFSNLTRNISETVNVFSVLDKADGKYTDLTFIVGSDRINDFKKLLDKYNNREDFYNFDTINVVSGGERDPEAKDITGVSGTKVRQFAREGDYNSFRKNMPSRLSERTAKEMFNKLRE